MYTNNKVGNVIYKVIEYFGDDVRRINHFLKVYGYVKMIGECENLDDSMQEILEVTAVLHDVGIKVAEQKYNQVQDITSSWRDLLLQRRFWTNLDTRMIL